MLGFLEAVSITTPTVLSKQLTIIPAISGLGSQDVFSNVIGYDNGRRLNARGRRPFSRREKTMAKRKKFDYITIVSQVGR